MLELDEGKLSRPVLRRGGESNLASLSRRVCSSVDTCSNEEGRGKGRGENAYKTMAEEQRAFQSLCEATDTVNGRQRAQCTVFRGLYDHVKGLSYMGLRAR